MTATVRAYYSTDASAPVLTGQAGSLITLLDAILVNGYGSRTAAGWTKPYTGTNLAAYKAGAGTPQPYLRVNDTTTTYARVIGYNAMTAISTGTDPFPSTALLSGGGYCQKSTTADATARPWAAFACERAFYLLTGCSQTVLTVTWSYDDSGVFFGVMPSFKSGDAFNSALMCATGTAGGSTKLGSIVSPSPTGSSGNYMCRNYLQTGSAILFNKIFSSNQKSSYPTQFASGPLVYPDPITGSMRLEKILFGESDNAGANRVERGVMPGVWDMLHTTPASYWDTFGGTNDLAGKTFRVVPLAADYTVQMAVIETNGSWGL